MTTNDQLIDAVEDGLSVLQSYREQLESVWPTPAPADCYLFAATEAGEASAALMLAAVAIVEHEAGISARTFAMAYQSAAMAIDYQLRQQARYSRNRSRFVEIENELTDCAMMLLSALPTGYDVTAPLRTRSYGPPPIDGIESLLRECGTLAWLSAHGNGAGWLHERTAIAAADTALLIGAEQFVQRLTQRLERIARRVLSNHVSNDVEASTSHEVAEKV